MEQTQTTPRVAPPRRRPLLAWFDVRSSRLGSWAFALNRLTGLALVFYLVLHLIVLSRLLGGQAGWDSFIAIVRSPLFLTLDVVLLFGILFHGLNGIRVAMVGTGIGVPGQKSFLRVLIALVVIILLVAAWRIFTI
jgi:succinate dehydrogenase / fumarate reductase cytochrome b subunit